VDDGIGLLEVAAAFVAAVGVGIAAEVEMALAAPRFAADAAASEREGEQDECRRSGEGGPEEGHAVIVPAADAGSIETYKC
jgi:hypothetical protein